MSDDSERILEIIREGEFMENVRMNELQPCTKCGWFIDEYGCVLRWHFSYALEDDRTSKVGLIPYAQLEKIPCRFFRTMKRIHQMLDPYFM